MKDIDLLDEEKKLPSNLFILPVGPVPVFPGLLTHLMFSEAQDIDVINKAIKYGGMIGLVLSRESSSEDEDNVDENEKNEETLYSVGTVAKIIKQIKLPDGGVHVFISTIKRFEITSFLNSGRYLVAQAKYLEDNEFDKEKLVPWSRQLFFEINKLAEQDQMLNEQIKLNMINIDEPGKLADFLISNLEISGEEQQKLLECLDIQERMEKLLVHIKNEQEISKIQKSILFKVNKKVEKQQREYFLRQELKTIQMELGMTSDPKTALINKLEKQISEVKKYFNQEVKEKVEDEIEKLKGIEMIVPDFNVTRNYLENILKLPWAPSEENNISIAKARKILNRDHYGMIDVKDRILEYLAVRDLKKDNKGAIICFVGAPGVGKTSIGKSIATALNKEYFRFSVGGMKDESEIKGHRRTYVGAIPGKIIKGLQTCKSNNPLFLIDEVDKMGQSFQGDPASALLEVLDPEQNFSFRDNYLDLPFDLSNVLFIATANSINGIPGPLLDRMELIEVGGYTSDEKVQIGKKYLVPKSLDKMGLNTKDIKFSVSILKKIAQEYSREAGVRNFEKNLNKVNRKLAMKIVENPEIERPIKVNDNDIIELLGIPYFTSDNIIIANKTGMAIGLAWTAMGGDTLAIEAQAAKGSGKLQLTGQLGDVMKESINIAYTYLKCHTKKYRLSEDYFNNYDIHIHVPEGAIKKDGPSAGITMTTAIYSLITNQIIKPNLAMTGELSLMGKVMPIGGLKEKVLAAKRNKIKEIIIPKQNKKDLDKLDEKVKKGIDFHIVEDVSNVLEIAFPNDKKAQRPIIESKKQQESSNQAKIISEAVSIAIKEALRG